MINLINDLAGFINDLGILHNVGIYGMNHCKEAALVIVVSPVAILTGLALKISSRKAVK
jgi:hypothetical protein